MLAQQGRLAESEARFQLWLAMESDDAEAHNNLGLVLAQQGRDKDAIVCYQKGCGCGPISRPPRKTWHGPTSASLSAWPRGCPARAGFPALNQSRRDGLPRQ